ncbi:MAG: hypothetical protein DRO93_15480, partial [Candidatus Thorarchaeota archaeon]
ISRKPQDTNMMENLPGRVGEVYYWRINKVMLLQHHLHINIIQILMQPIMQQTIGVIISQEHLEMDYIMEGYTGCGNLKVYASVTIGYNPT